MRVLVLILIASLAGPTLASGATNSRWWSLIASKFSPMKNAYHRLSDQLSKNEPSDELEENIKAAVDIKKDLPYRDAAFSEALAKFVALGKVNDDNICSVESQEILLDIYRPITRRAKDLIHHWLESRRRLNKLVQNLMDMHVHRCVTVYAAEWDKKSLAPFEGIEVNLEKFALRSYLAITTSHHMRKLHLKPKYEGKNEQLRHFETIMTRYANEPQIHHQLDDIWAIHGAMEIISKAHGDTFHYYRQPEMGKDTVAEHLDEYLVRPCEALDVLHPEEASLLSRTANALSSIRLSDPFIESMLGVQQVATKQQIDHLIDWTTRYISCKRLLAANKGEIVDALHVWTSESQDEDQTNQIVKFLSPNKGKKSRS